MSILILIYVCSVYLPFFSCFYVILLILFPLYFITLLSVGALKLLSSGCRVPQVTDSAPLLQKAKPGCRSQMIWD